MLVPDAQYAQRNVQLKRFKGNGKNLIYWIKLCARNVGTVMMYVNSGRYRLIKRDGREERIWQILG
jgi:hypothetical protein